MRHLVHSLKLQVVLPVVTFSDLTVSRFQIFKIFKIFCSLPTFWYARKQSQPLSEKLFLHDFSFCQVLVFWLRKPSAGTGVLRPCVNYIFSEQIFGVMQVTIEPPLECSTWTSSGKWRLLWSSRCSSWEAGRRRGCLLLKQFRSATLQGPEKVMVVLLIVQPPFLSSSLSLAISHWPH